VFNIVIATSIPILLASIDRVLNVDPVLTGTAKTLGQTTSRIFRTVLLPAALPSIATGLRTSMAIALIVGVSSEMILSPDGLGHRVVYAQRMLRIPELYASVFTLALAGYLLNHLLQLGEQLLLSWHYLASHRKAH
jgi:ABC-type nitrate/sulfonate/bicarbonate transport system permease component